MKNILILLALCVPFFAGAQNSMAVGVASVKIQTVAELSVYPREAFVVQFIAAEDKFYVYDSRGTRILYVFLNSEVSVAGSSATTGAAKIQAIVDLSPSGGGGGGGGVVQIDPAANTIKTDPFNNTINHTQINGNAVATANGPVTSGTQRVSLASDGNKVVQVNSAGTNLSMDAGTATAATPRVTIATDNILKIGNSAGAALATGIGAADATTLRTTATIVTASTSGTSTITAGGTAQVLFAANTSRLGFEIKNDSAADLYFSIGGPASATTGFKLLPGQGYSSPHAYSSSAAVSVWGATTGQQFTAIQYAL